MKIEKATYNYDDKLDILDIKVNKSYVYKESICLDAGIYLDFDENYSPVFFEFIDASKRLKIDKKHLKNPNVKVSINISNALINFNLCISYYMENEIVNESFNRNIANNYNIPDMEENFALI